VVGFNWLRQWHTPVHELDRLLPASTVNSSTVRALLFRFKVTVVPTQSGGP
jgi:hypothetical protein